MIFTTYTTRRGVSKEYRREYLSFRLMPVSDTYGANLQRLYSTMERPYWNNFLLEGNRVRANTTVTSSLVTEYIFDYSINRDSAYIKVTNILYSTLRLKNGAEHLCELTIFMASLQISGTCGFQLRPSLKRFQCSMCSAFVFHIHQRKATLSSAFAAVEEERLARVVCHLWKATLTVRLDS
jgi:hypothetical protein